MSAYSVFRMQRGASALVALVFLVIVAFVVLTAYRLSGQQLMLAGNAVRAPHGLLDPARTLTAHIALVKAADFDSLEFRSIFACGIALYLFTTAATLAVRWLEGQRGAIS